MGKQINEKTKQSFEGKTGLDATQDGATLAEVEIPRSACPASVKKLIHDRRHDFIPYQRFGCDAKDMVLAIFDVVGNECEGIYPWGLCLQAANFGSEVAMDAESDQTWSSFS